MGTVRAGAWPRPGGLRAAAASSAGGTVALPLPPLGRRERRAKSTGGLGQRVGAFVASLPDHPWLDRLVRGRAWIPVLGVLLAGIVFTQVEILKLGAGIGRALEQTTTLTNENQQLQESVATLGDDQRIERLASSFGMVLPPPGAVGYLAAGPGNNVAGALANVHSPNPSAFVALTPQAGDGALVTGPGTSTLPPSAGAPPPPATGAGTSSSAATTFSAATAASAAGTAPATGTSTGYSSATGAPQTQSGSATTAPSSGTTSQSATTSQTANAAAPATTGQTGSGTSTDQSSQGPPTGAAAIQPAASSQQSGGG